MVCLLFLFSVNFVGDDVMLMKGSERCTTTVPKRYLMTVSLFVTQNIRR